MKWKWRIILAAAIAAILVVNHGEHYLRAKRIRQAAQERDEPVVRIATNAAGHTSIQIDEQSLGRGYLYFNTLESWAYSPQAPARCPESVLEANARQVKLMGFMYPLQDSPEMTAFCLLRSTQTCCYGPQPQFNQYVFVETRQPVKFERLAPVVVEGRFFVDPKPEEGYIYRMEGSLVRPAAANDQPASAEDFARENHLPIFDFAPLEAAKAAGDREAQIVRLSAGQDGKEMVVSGFVVGREANASPPKVMIGKYAWDGKAKGTPPNLYNTVLVSLRGPGDLPPLWWQEAVFKGAVRVTTDASQRARSGIVALRDAALAVAPVARLAVDGGPLLSPSFELLMLAGYGGMFLMGLFSARAGAGKTPSRTSTGERR